VADLPARLATRADVDRLLAQATNYEQVKPDGPRAFDLTRMERLLEALGSPHLGPRTLHVAGSKGKGSTCRMLAAALSAAGRGPVGLTTSPHLVDLAERIEIDGRPVDEDGLLEAFRPLLPYAARHAGTPLAPTFFELVTAAAWCAFRAHGCRWVVLETGLGGRLDATTVCRPDAVAITTIELEHTQLLGDTVERIAAEKAGILKAGVPCVTGARGRALEVIEARARALGAPLERLGEEILLEDVRVGPGWSTSCVVRRGGLGFALGLPVLGAHQAENAALAAALLARVGLSTDDVVQGLAGTRLPAALEPFPGTPWVVLDGAHTEASAHAARASLEAACPGRPRVLLLALLAEKRVDAILDALLPGALAVVATQVDSPRALPAEELAARVRARSPLDVHVVPAPQAALARAREACRGDAYVLATGSLYLAGTLRSLLLQG
jgi:dihydrofolate synthase/folylpolyglutamate synthase